MLSKHQFKAGNKIIPEARIRATVWLGSSKGFSGPLKSTCTAIIRVLYLIIVWNLKSGPPFTLQGKLCKRILHIFLHPFSNYRKPWFLFSRSQFCCKTVALFSRLADYSMIQAIWTSLSGGSYPADEEFHNIYFILQNWVAGMYPVWLRRIWWTGK